MRIASIVGGLVLTVAASAQAQTCQHTIIPPTYADTIYADIAVNSGSCTTPSGKVEDGTYVKKGLSLTLHSWTQADGHCTLRTMSGWPPQCVVTNEQDRYVYKITLTTAYPNQTSGPSYIQPSPSTQKLQLFDSRNANTTGPLTSTLLQFGTYTYTFNSTVNVTACQILPAAGIPIALRVHSLKCDPEFSLVGNPTQIKHLPPQQIQIYVPSSLSGLNAAVDGAASAWQSAGMSR